MTDLDQVKTKLATKLHEMLARHSRLSAHLRNEDRELPADWSEMAQFVENDEVLEHLEARTRDRVDAIRQAIERIENGSYATCTGCGGQIQPQRLELLPASPLCAACAG